MEPDLPTGVSFWREAQITHLQGSTPRQGIIFANFEKRYSFQSKMDVLF